MLLAAKTVKRDCYVSIRLLLVKCPLVYYCCPRRVRAQRPKPEEASLESPRIVFVLVVVYKKKIQFAQTGTQGGIGSF